MQARRRQIEIDQLRAEEMRLRRRVVEQRTETAQLLSEEQRKRFEEARRQAEENARLYQEARAALSARDEFFSVAAHELKTPVTSLRGFAQLELRRLRNGTSAPEDLQYALETIIQQADRLNRLVGDMLDATRMDSGKLRLECQALDLTSLVSRLVQRVRGEDVSPPIQVAGEAAYVKGDAGRLEQVAGNLLDNALKYSPADVPIHVSVESVSADQPESAGGAGSRMVRLAVRDFGPGVPDESRDRIFERFYQAHSGRPGAATSFVPGMGLGLYISRQIVELHGGRIWVEKPEDGGACFVVSLPALDAPAT
jgi:signal transduction histidine kinase